jgi:hypothetical protein
MFCLFFTCFSTKAKSRSESKKTVPAFRKFVINQLKFVEMRYCHKQIIIKLLFCPAQLSDHAVIIPPLTQAASRNAITALPIIRSQVEVWFVFPLSYCNDPLLYIYHLFRTQGTISDNTVSTLSVRT